jgi:hypothetical protein
VPAVSVPGRLTSRLLAPVRTSHSITVILVPIPPFNKLSAFAAVFRKEINENHNENTRRKKIRSQDNGTANTSFPSVV